MQQFCHSCAAPLNVPDFKGPADNYCVNCTDAKGILKTRQEVKYGLAEWLKMWQPDLSQEKALMRADNYMNAMPAWTEV